jgi:hypothetical protein
MSRKLEDDTKPIKVVRLDDLVQILGEEVGAGRILRELEEKKLIINTKYDAYWNRYIIKKGGNK